MDIHHTLDRLGYDFFREGQEKAINHLLAGRHALVVLPTGIGKSLIYQIAALHTPGVALVISPLIALMKDQVDKLNTLGIPATFINSTLTQDEQFDRIERMVRGEYQLVYVAPERLRQYFFQEKICRLHVGLLAVDEAHCISHWGHDFRPDYLYINSFREFIGNPVTAALTATATPRVKGEIKDLLGINNAQKVTTGFDRPNIKIEVEEVTSRYKQESQKLAMIAEHLQTWKKGTVISNYSGCPSSARGMKGLPTKAS